MILMLELKKQEIENKRKKSDIAHHIGLSFARTRIILSEMDDIEVTGGNSNRWGSLYVEIKSGNLIMDMV